MAASEMFDDFETGDDSDCRSATPPAMRLFDIGKPSDAKYHCQSEKTPYEETFHADFNMLRTPLQHPPCVLYVFLCVENDLRNEMIRFAAAATYYATGDSELLTWIMSGAHALMPFRGGPADWYAFEFIDASNVDDIEAFMREQPEYFKTSLSVLKKMDDDVTKHAVMCMCAMLIKTRPRWTGYHRWYCKRMKAFMGTLKHPWNISKGMIPFKHATYINMIMDKSLSLRRALFFAVGDAAKIDLVGAVYSSALQLLRMAKMTGLDLILRFMLDGTIFPILHLDRWLTERRNLIMALNTWLSYPENEQPYLRIIYDDARTRQLHESNYERLVYAAWLIACKRFPSWEKYRVRISFNPEPVKADVEKFLKLQSGMPYFPQSRFPSVPGRLSTSDAEQDREAEKFRRQDLQFNQPANGKI